MITSESSQSVKRAHAKRIAGLRLVHIEERLERAQKHLLKLTSLPDSASIANAIIDAQTVITELEAEHRNLSTEMGFSC